MAAARDDDADEASLLGTVARRPPGASRGWGLNTYAHMIPRQDDHARITAAERALPG